MIQQMPSGMGQMAVAAAPMKPVDCEVCSKTVDRYQNFVTITSIEFGEDAGSSQGRMYFHKECFIQVAGKRYLPDVVVRRRPVSASGKVPHVPYPYNLATIPTKADLQKMYEKFENSEKRKESKSLQKNKGSSKESLIRRKS